MERPDLQAPHDPRVFRHWAKLNADGTVAAIVETAAVEPDAGDGALYVEVTSLYPSDLGKVKIAAPPIPVKPVTPDPGPSAGPPGGLPVPAGPSAAARQYAVDRHAAQAVAFQRLKAALGRS